MRVLLLAGFFLWAIHSASKGKILKPLVIAGIGALIARYFDAVHRWVGTLGADSFSEAQNFDWGEAVFYLRTISTIFLPTTMHKWLETIAIAAAISLVLAAVLWLLVRRAGKLLDARWFGRGVAALSLICVSTSLGYEISRVSKNFEINSERFLKVQNNYAGNENLISLKGTPDDKMRLVVYIGESTAQMNWSLYGYPLQTTPMIQKFAHDNDGFISFSQLIPTHVHTSPSLLEALSFGLPGENAWTQVEHRKRASLISVLNRAGIPTVLYTTQGAVGVWNQASSVIFSQASFREYANPESVFLGTRRSRTQIFDDEFFAGSLAKADKLVPDGPAVIFLHSYAGHGEYLNYIPSWSHNTGSGFFETAGLEDIYGKAVDDPHASFVQDYDDVIRYIDGILGRLLEQVRGDDRPTVFIYFPDHGESSITGLGHDSSRLQHEMLRIPFLMYFNAAARSQAPELFERFRQASALDRPATLAQVPATIMTLLGVRAEGTQHDYAGVGLDPEPALVPVVVRQLGDGVTYVRSHNAVQGMGLVQASSTIHAPERVQLSYSRQSGAKTALEAKIRDATDPATAIWLYTRQAAAGDGRPGICYSQADTWGKMNRGALVADCISVRLKEVSDWPLQAAMRVAAARSKTLWLDGTDMPAEQACRLAAALHPYTDSDSAPASSAYAYADSGAGVVADDVISVKNAQPASLSAHSVSQAVIVLELSPDATETMPQACRELQSQGATLYLRVPDTVTLSTDVSESTWVQIQAMQAWPANYSFTTPPAPGVLQQLLSTPGASWALGNIRVDELPLQPRGNTPAPAMLLIDTSWDINSR